jgi:Putative transposase
LKRLEQINKKDELKIKDETLFHESMITVTEKDWNVYAKAPFGGPAQIIEYLGRYTHKVAITTHRITEIAADTITFNYKDYRDNSKVKLMTLSHQEFLRRFEQHILPRGFVKIRHAGFLTNRNKMERINKILSQLNLPKAKPKVSIPTPLLLLIKTGTDITKCPKCEVGKMIRTATFINVNGVLINIDSINNRGSPNKIKPRIITCKN